MSTLLDASQQWSKRPADERFSSLDALHSACAKWREQSAEAPDINLATVRASADAGEVVLIGKTEAPAKLTHWSFGQLSTRVGAPAGYLRELPATLAVQNLNHGLTRQQDTTVNLLMHRNGGMRVRSLLSGAYTRIWNHDITTRLQTLVAENPQWQPAPAAFDGSRGLYASDHDLFVFMVDNNRRIFESDPNGGLSRGFFIWNSEVGGRSFGVKTFLYNYVCGNHIVWGAKNVAELRIRHVGSADRRAFRELAVEVRRYSDASAGEEEQRIKAARLHVIGKTKDEVLAAVFGMRVPGITQKVAAQAYARAVDHEDWYGNPNSTWGMVNGLTEVARDMPFTDERVDLEKAASKLLDKVAF